jgi:hypothetical protein
MYANPDVWCCLLSGQASSGSNLVDCEPIEEGGVVGCHINSNDGTVTFYRNDEFLLQFDNLNEHPAMVPGDGMGRGEYADPMSRGVRPFVCLETGGDSIYFIGSKSEESVITYPESDPQCRSSFSGRIINGNFEGLCEQHIWGQDGRWVGHYRDGVREGTHLWVTPKLPTKNTDLVPETAQDIIPEKSPGSELPALKGLEAPVATPAPGGEVAVSSPAVPAVLPPSGLPASDAIPPLISPPGQVPPDIIPPEGTPSGESTSSAPPDATPSQTLPALALGSMSSEEFTVISKYELYEHGVFIRALTEEEIEKDPVVAECLKSIEEEREKIMLERLAALCGAVPPPGAAADKKKKNAKKTKAEKARPKSG